MLRMFSAGSPGPLPQIDGRAPSSVRLLDGLPVTLYCGRLLSGKGLLMPNARSGLKKAIVRALIGALGIVSNAPAQVRISEIHYNPPEGDELEFIEVHNAGAAAVDISGWSLAEGVQFAFPAGTT